MLGKKALALPIIAIYLAIGIASYSLGETYYRWTDDRGNPVHSDRPPPEGIDYEVMSTQSTLMRSVEGDKGAVPKKVKPTVSNDFEPVQTRKVMVEKNPEYCQRARKNLETLNGPARIRLRNDQGEYRYISEEEKAEQRQLAMDSISVHCE